MSFFPIFIIILCYFVGGGDIWSSWCFWWYKRCRWSRAFWGTEKEIQKGQLKLLQLALLISLNCKHATGFCSIAPMLKKGLWTCCCCFELVYALFPHLLLTLFLIWLFPVCECQSINALYYSFNFPGFHTVGSHMYGLCYVAATPADYL